MIQRSNVELALAALATFVDDNDPEHAELASARDALAHDLRPPADPWVCSACGSAAVLEAVYVSANTGEVTSDFDPGTDPICPDCHSGSRGMGDGMMRLSELEEERLLQDRD